MSKPLVSIMMPTLGDREELAAWQEWGRFVMKSRDEFERMQRDIAERKEKKSMEYEAMRIEWERFEEERARKRWNAGCCFMLGACVALLLAYIIIAL